ncbi:MAG: HAD family hydrolase [Anaerolineae bacterium]|nr:HAD family hydrolase [Anaerolineae bacterium]
MALKRLVLFDIDGTLLWPDGIGRVSMKSALEQVYGTAGPIGEYRFAGYTDRRTARMLLQEAGLPPEQIWDRFEMLGPAMEAALREALRSNRHDIRPCPGAIRMIDMLASREDVVLGLVTGNLRHTAPIKLAAAGFDPLVFRVGAYGEEAEARAELPLRAIERARQLTGVSFRGAQVVIIGDTPDDVLCGRGVGARSIAVMTGWVERAALEAQCPDYIFDDLSNAQILLDAIMAPTEVD